MKIYLLLFISIFSIENSIAQCSFSFEELYKSTNYTFSDFDTFALRNGYTFNTNKDTFVCDTAYKEGASLQLLRSKTESGYNMVQNIFFSKQSYLTYKEVLESKGNLYETNTDNNSLTLQYIYDNKLVMLQTKTFNSTAVYLITLTNEELH